MPKGIYARKPIKERFEERIEFIPESGCWIWMGGSHCRNYGGISVNNKTESAHRVSYTIYKGTIPDSMQVLHFCDTPPCVNPHHLFLGNQSENIKDCVRKKRHRNSNVTHCPKGHEYTSKNTYIFKNSRQCIACKNAHVMDWYYRNKSK